MTVDNVDLARIQFASTTIYHFLFVPVTIGLSFLVAILQTKWHRSGDDRYLRLTKFFGNILLINVAIGVVTGIVQEFEFGMNWSAYSRFVGDVFGAPLAMEGLAAFFLESTFLGLWIFGWNRLPRRIHLASIWAVAIGASLSAMFIVMANSWMQNPVGYELDPQTGRPVLNDIGALFTNPVFRWSYAHVILAAIVSGALVMLSVSAWKIRRKVDPEIFAKSAKVALIILIPAILLQMRVGGQLGQVEAVYQPMKIAAAEGQWETCQPCSFSAFQIGGGNNDPNATQVIEIPHLLSVLATGTWNGEVQGMNQLQAQYEQEYGPGNYIPNVFLQYWGMRVMAYLAAGVMLMSLWGGWVLWRRRLNTSRWFLGVASISFFALYAMNTAGWVLAENGRQPWIVQGLLKTEDGVSSTVSTTELWISLAMFYAIYVGMGVAYVLLQVRAVRKDLPPPPDDPSSDELEPGDDDAERLPALTY
ncbi:MAG: cytochrome ubiquinol oxidase subunit I [Ilumatobacteraceae bacterium]